jgi:hypothetical protein
MSFSNYLRKRLIDLLNDRRIVVWYDAEGDFKTFAGSFNAPNCELLSSEKSVLKTRRRADEVYRLMNESDNPAESGRCLLIYVPGSRGATEDEKMQDPFEVYALAGAAFGDTEDQKIESLARQAMPEKADEITRLFSEGRPDMTLLDGLGKAQSRPLIKQVFNTTNESDVIALALCDAAKAKAVDETPGCVEELLRLVASALGFKPKTDDRTWKTIRKKTAEYILFSEFVFDLPDGAPESLSAVPRAPVDAKNVVYSACERMRSDSGLRESYIELAQAVESGLRLPEIMSKDFNPGERDTFPFEERRLLSVAVEYMVTGELNAARNVIEKRRQSIWRKDARRTPAWTSLERAVVLMESAAKVTDALSGKTGLRGLVKAYTEGGLSDMDRGQRLFETALTACTDEAVLSPVIDLCRKSYRESAVALQDDFLKAVQEEGWPPEGVFRQTCVFNEHAAAVLERREKTAFFLVDSLRYEMGRDLGEALAGVGEVEIRHAAGVVPTVTGCGMAALMPDADGMLRLVEKDGGFVTAVGPRILKTSSDRMKLLAETFGDRFFETTLDDLLSSFKKVSKTLKEKDLLVVRTQDPDVIGENLGQWRARRYLSDVIGDIAATVKMLVPAGFNRVLISADHGHMMLPEIPAGDVVQSPPGGWLENKRRCRLGSGLSGGPGTITLKAAHVGIQGDVQEICLPIGFRVFSNGGGYFHGGLSLQEAVVPVLVFRAVSEGQTVSGKPEVDIRYRSDRFTSRVIGLKIHLQSDIFGTPARVRIEAYDGKGAGAALVGDAADCEARDERTREVILQAGEETPVPVLIDPDFDGPEIEIRVSDPETRVVWKRHKLKNAMLD